MKNPIKFVVDTTKKVHSKLKAREARLKATYDYTKVGNDIIRTKKKPAK